MADFESERRLLELLEELETYESVDWVTAAMYELAVSKLVSEEEAGSEVGQAVARALRTQIRYCRHMEDLTQRSYMPAEELTRLTEARRAALLDTVEAVSRALPHSLAARAVREVVLAQCYYELGNLARTVAHLERALEAGVTEPLLYLVLGYVRYQHTLEAHAPLDKLDEQGRLSFQLGCLRAVSAFEGGLGGDLDAQLYWWMATVLEAAGFEQAAREAYENARRAEEQYADDEAEEFDEEAEFALAEGELEEAERVSRRMPAISAAEVQQVAEALRASNALMELLDSADSDSEN